LESGLIGRYQRDMPIEPQPYRAMGRELGVDEEAILRSLRGLVERRMVSRVGPVFRPHAVGCSTLAALAVSPPDLTKIAELVNGYDAVNHNYERLHRWNLWFVVTGANRPVVQDVLADIERRTGLEVLDLPLELAYHIDLGFTLGPVGAQATRVLAPPREPGGVVARLDPGDHALIATLQQGLTLEPRPFGAAARQSGHTESEVLSRLARWQAEGLLSRFGVVVRHHELGYRANAMVVWDIPDRDVDRVGRAFARHRFVTLCYRRPRRPPHWRYNLFCMIHGRDPDTVRAQARQLRLEQSLPDEDCELLFSLRRFKQRGARYRPASEVVTRTRNAGHG
jgi:DNA-binding Lrp family transcriptional regulator